jgi:hypothetical protein
MVVAAVAVITGLLLPPAHAQQGRVATTVHNLSVSGPGTIKSQTETEICKFCHIPHNPVVPEPLWGHALSSGQRYDMPEMLRTSGVGELTPQPDGSSRLCLSCHDGTVALGDVAGQRRPIPMAGSQMLQRGQRGFIGSDLSGSHPISFVVRDRNDRGLDDDVDMSIKPLAVIATDHDVKLDEDGKMQCTTCHDPHMDSFHQPGRTPRFWVKPTLEEVCLTCHELR